MYPKEQRITNIFIPIILSKSHESSQNNDMICALISITHLVVIIQHY